VERRVTTRWLEWLSVGWAKVEVMQKEVRGATIGARPGGDTHMPDRDTTEQVLYTEKCSSGRSDDKRDTNFLKLQYFLRFALQVLGPAQLNTDELIFTQFTSVPVFTGVERWPLTNDRQMLATFACRLSDSGRWSDSDQDHVETMGNSM